MRSGKRGGATSNVEVEAISRHGIWILVDHEELFLSFEDFPWFQDAPVSGILHVERPRENYLYWPTLDVDLDVDSIRDPRHFPLVSRERPAQTPGPGRRKSVRKKAATRGRSK